MDKHKFTKEELIKGGKNSKRKPLNEMWRDKLESIPDGDDKTRLEKLFDIMTMCASDGNMQAIKELLDRTYGRAIQPIQHTGDSEQPVIIRTEQQKKFIEGDE